MNSETTILPTRVQISSESMDTVRTTRLDLIPLAPEALENLIRGDRDGAAAALGLDFPDEFPTPGEREGFLRVQLERMEAAPQRRDWMACIMVSSSDRSAIGHCGFHGPPEMIGRAEIGYTVFTHYRGQGYAKEAAGALVDWAFAQGASEVYASVARTTRRRSPWSAVSASPRSGHRSTRSTDSSWSSSAVRTPARQGPERPREKGRLRSLDLHRDRGGRVDERRRGRRSESIAMPDDCQHPRRDRLRKLRHTRRRLHLIDREQRRER